MSLGFNNTPPVRFEGPRPDVVSAPRFFLGGDPDFPSGCRANNSRFLQQKTMSTEDRINQGVAHASPSFDYRNGVRSVRVCRLWGGTAPRVITMTEAPARFLPVLRSAPISRRSPTVAGVRRGTVMGLRIPEP